MKKTTKKEAITKKDKAALKKMLMKIAKPKKLPPLKGRVQDLSNEQSMMFEHMRDLSTRLERVEKFLNSWDY